MSDHRQHRLGRSRSRPARRRRPPPSTDTAPLRARQRRLGRAMLALVLLIGAAVAASAVTARLDDGDAPADALRHQDPASLTAVTVSRVIDGDTFDARVADVSLRVRLFGVDAPERDERCGSEATARLAALVSGGARLLADARLTDDFGRDLRYVYTLDGRSVDAMLVAEGLARAWTADGSLRDALVALEAAARAGREGCLWAGA